MQPVFKAYETMTSISAGTNAFLTSSWHKNYNNSASVYDIVATSSIIYMRLYNGSIYTLSIFGDFYSLKAGDINNTIAVGNAAGYNTAVDGCYTRETMATIANHALCRAHTQTGTGIACGKCGGPWGDNQYMGRSWFTYPSHMDGGLHLDTVKITEGAAGFRGVLPGLWVPMHGNYWQDRTIIEGAGPFAGKLFMVWYLGPPSGSDGRVFIEISDTWGLYNG